LCVWLAPDRVAVVVVVKMASWREAFALSKSEVNERMPPGTVRILGQSQLCFSLAARRSLAVVSGTRIVTDKIDDLRPAG
jgi:hypothetical protein